MPTIEHFWREACAALQIDPVTPYQTWYFGDSPALADTLLDLVLQGSKRATACLQWACEADPQDAPVPGGYSVVTRFDGTPAALLRTTALAVVPFGQVDAGFAAREGEGDLSLASWREGHWAYFSRECAAAGWVMGEDAPVVCEDFELLWPRPPR